jgi:hypothetical protein
MLKIFFVIFLPGIAISQQRNDNAVIVHNVTFDSAVSKLIELGHQIRVVDKELKTCITLPSVSGLSIYVRADKKGDIVISGEFTTSYLGSGTSGIERVTYFKHGLQHDRWEEMMKYAGQFPDKEYKIVK